MEVKIAAQKVLNKFVQLYSTADKAEVGFPSVISAVLYCTFLSIRPTDRYANLMSQ